MKFEIREPLFAPEPLAQMNASTSPSHHGGERPRRPTSLSAGRGEITEITTTPVIGYPGFGLEPEDVHVANVTPRSLTQKTQASTREPSLICSSTSTPVLRPSPLARPPEPGQLGGLTRTIRS
jgi:hypothetical protein